MKKPVLESLSVTFRRDHTEVNVSYSGPSPNPGTKARLELARGMALAGLGKALEGLGEGEIGWGGHSEGTVGREDVLLIEGRGAVERRS